MATVHVMTRRDDAAMWTSNNPTLTLGEEGLEMDTRRYKVGDGITPWVSLPYWGGGGEGSEVFVKTVTTATYGLVAADNNYIILFTNIMGCVVTVPTTIGAGILFSPAFMCHLHQETLNAPVSVVGAAGVTIKPAGGLLAATRAINSSLSLICQAVDTIKIIGDAAVAP